MSIDYLARLPYYIPCNELKPMLIDEHTLKFTKVENLTTLKRSACQKCLLLASGAASIQYGKRGELICSINAGTFSRTAIDFAQIQN